ncbi:MAG: hypothetical protein M0Z51_16650 [Propionibacterium sp.]|nr:hypothetical protein [Propionibacterium sp.]
MTHDLAAPLRTLAAALAPMTGLPLSDPANLCVAAAHELNHLEGRVADLTFELDQARGTARPFAPVDGGKRMNAKEES